MLSINVLFGFAIIFFFAIKLNSNDTCKKLTYCPYFTTVNTINTVICLVQL